MWIGPYLNFKSASFSDLMAQRLARRWLSPEPGVFRQIRVIAHLFFTDQYMYCCLDKANILVNILMQQLACGTENMKGNQSSAVKVSLCEILIMNFWYIKESYLVWIHVSNMYSSSSDNKLQFYILLIQQRILLITLFYWYNLKWHSRLMMQLFWNLTERSSSFSKADFLGKV